MPKYWLGSCLTCPTSSAGPVWSFFYIQFMYWSGNLIFDSHWLGNLFFRFRWEPKSIDWAVSLIFIAIISPPTCAAWINYIRGVVVVYKMNITKTCQNIGWAVAWPARPVPPAQCGHSFIYSSCIDRAISFLILIDRAISFFASGGSQKALIGQSHQYSLQ